MLAIQELKLVIRILAVQFIYGIIMFCINYYLIQDKESGFIWAIAIPIFIISLFITCNYILISQKIVLMTIFSAIISSSIYFHKIPFLFFRKSTKTFSRQVNKIINML